MNDLMKNLTQIRNDLLEQIERDSYYGYDPFDGLNARAIPSWLLRSKISRLCVIQFFKHCPINLRKLFGVQPGLNSKCLGLMLSTYAILGRQRNAETVYLKLKQQLQNGTFPSGWGYYFDWQNRVFYIPKNTPTVVNTSFIVMGLVDCYRRFGDKNFLELAMTTVTFYLEHLNFFTPECGRSCVSYTPIDHSQVHNANLLAATAMLELSQFSVTDSQRLKELAKACIRFSLSDQKENGSWVYGGSDTQSFIDSFHTIFNIMSLEKSQHFFDDDLILKNQIEHALDVGVSFYFENFISNAGFCSYYPNDYRWSDSHCPAALFWLLSRLCPSSHDSKIQKFIKWFVYDFCDNGIVPYRYYKWWRNKIVYQRWTNAWIIFGLTSYLSRSRIEENYLD